MRRSPYLLALLPLLGLSFRAIAQADETATRRNELTVSAGYLYLKPDYVDPHASGVMVAVDFSTYVRHHIWADAEARANLGSNPQLTERTVLFGPRVHTRLARRFYPYGDILIGGGTIVFKRDTASYHEDRSTVFSFGGGLDVQVAPQWRVKVDAQGQHWNLGRTSSLKGDVVFAPIAVSVGVEYRIPFGPRRHGY